MIRWLFFIAFFSLVQWYAFQAIKTLGLSRWTIYLYFGAIAIVGVNFIYHISTFSRSTGFTPVISYLIFSASSMAFPSERLAT